jgi:putative ABC transport system permease protein
MTGAPGQISELHIITTQEDPETEQQVVQSLQARFKENKTDISSTQTGLDWHQQNISQSNVLIYSLMIMACLIALVGGLGLMGSMTMNVMERIREIGVMRAIGATNRDIQNIVILEGLLVGLVSWFLSIFLSIPITLALNYGVGAILVNTPLNFVFGSQGILTWLVGVLIIATLSCLLPAWNASRFTIREVLAYE